jgi:hypothetical protein
LLYSVDENEHLHNLFQRIKIVEHLSSGEPFVGQLCRVPNASSNPHQSTSIDVCPFPIGQIDHFGTGFFLQAMGIEITSFTNWMLRGFMGGLLQKPTFVGRLGHELLAKLLETVLHVQMLDGATFLLRLTTNNAATVLRKPQLPQE